MRIANNKTDNAVADGGNGNIIFCNLDIKKRCDILLKHHTDNYCSLVTERLTNYYCKRKRTVTSTLYVNLPAEIEDCGANEAFSAESSTASMARDL